MKNKYKDGFDNVNLDDLPKEIADMKQSLSELINKGVRTDDLTQEFFSFSREFFNYKIDQFDFNSLLEDESYTYFNLKDSIDDMSVAFKRVNNKDEEKKLFVSLVEKIYTKELEEELNSMLLSISKDDYSIEDYEEDKKEIHHLIKYLNKLDIKINPSVIEKVELINVERQKAFQKEAA